MSNFRVALGGLVALSCLAGSGCDRGATKSGPSCDTAANQVITTLTGGDKTVNTMEAKAAVVKTCTERKWRDEARTCIAKAQAKADLDMCRHETLTGAQDDWLKGATSTISSSSTKAAMKKMHEFADKMCQCKDAACAQVVSDEMTKWGQEMAKSMDEPPKMSEEDTKEAVELGQRMGECMTKAMGAGDPTLEGAGSGHGNVDEPHVRPGDRALHEGDIDADGRMISK